MDKRQGLVSLAFWIALFVSMYFAFSSSNPPLIKHYSDTVLHGSAFLILTVGLSLAYFKVSAAFKPAAWMLVYAIFIECVQYYLPTRTFELGDIGVDICGIIAGLAVYRFVVSPIVRYLDQHFIPQKNQ
ncbi:MAG: VanZ family protein [Pseudomonadales bacterium]|nr:VanZ family protein [Pseudomonadales bacterium]